MLRGEERLLLRREPRGAAKKRGSATAPAAFAREDDQRLWEALRRRRRELAAAQGVPPYVVFHDATLAEMVQRRPGSLAELAEVSGVGERKLEVYGAEFLQVIRGTDESARPTD